jgi:peptidyl-prolyl cis-trans isomerase A (cyclophilin A)
MWRSVPMLLAALCVGAALPTAACAEGGKKPVVLIKTSKGEFRVELEAERAPVTVENFLAYADAGFYDGTVFHRVIDGFMIQGGGFTPDMGEKPTRAPITNEAKNGLKNTAGSIAMARTRDPHSASAQFFINLVNNPRLDYPSFDGWGYAVFGKVVKGMEVVNKIGQVPTGMAGPHRDVPLKPVVIQTARIVAEPAGK